MPTVRVTNQQWTAIHNGTFVGRNTGARNIYLMIAGAQPAPTVSVKEGVPFTVAEELTDFAINGQWWGKCNNEASAEINFCDMAVLPY